MANQDVTCRYCGQSFGNAGAKTNHERACDQNPQSQQAAPAQGQPHAPQPAQQQQAQPATYQGADSPGGTLADAAIAAVDDDIPADARRQALKNGLGIVGDAIVRYQSYRERKMQQQRERAANADLEPVTEYPECDCGYQFDGTDVGLNIDEVRCPDCNALYRVVDGDQAQDAPQQG